jgi:hypothetical protein
VPHPHHPAAVSGRDGHRPATVARSTVRIGVALSVLAAIATVLLEAALDVPVALIVAPVVVVGFALSWQASGRRRGPGPVGRATMTR